MIDQSVLDRALDVQGELRLTGFLER